MKARAPERADVVHRDAHGPRLHLQARVRHVARARGAQLSELVACFRRFELKPQLHARIEREVAAHRSLDLARSILKSIRRSGTIADRAFMGTARRWARVEAIFEKGESAILRAGIDNLGRVSQIPPGLPASPRRVSGAPRPERDKDRSRSIGRSARERGLHRVAQRRDALALEPRVLLAPDRIPR